MSTEHLPANAGRLTGLRLPAPLLDPTTLPPPILTSELGSFAQDTLRRRIPAILQEAIDLNPDGDGGTQRGLEELGTELHSGRIRELREDAPDVALWNAVSAPHFGRSWLDVPWYWAEAYFYRRLLEATGYFQDGGGRGFDPFGMKKRTEWAVDAAPAAVAALLAGLPADPAARFEQLFHASLWGNRTDLSYMVAAHLGGTANSYAERENLLADDTAATWEWLR
ncbi:MAG: damage-control phosphatase ARMT1 family protein, partial [Anaerolineae bacterium]|nr:damage-control phosphatase ARMT1 family protein [Anaerolineae bacterium]